MFGYSEENAYLCTRKTDMVPVVQLVRASDCGSECRGFESHRAPKVAKIPKIVTIYCCYITFSGKGMYKTGII